jgi:hypothetical protein
MNQKCRVCLDIGPAIKVVDKYYQLDCDNCDSTSFYFEQGYEYGNDEKYSDRAYLDNYELRWAHEIIEAYLLDVNYKVKCLEVGCFNGQFVNELRLKGVDSFGTDII